MPTINILIVEDELLIANNLSRALKRLGYSVIDIVSSGEAAIQVAAKQRPDLILMDIVIKGEINGIEAAKQIQNNYHIPIVFLTAYADHNTVSQAKEHGGYGFIVKPYQAEQLNATIQMAIGQHQTATAAWKQATTDALTGVGNRRYFMDLATQEFDRALRYQDSFSVLMIDIDHFKQINDHYGHAFGDEVIKVVAQAVLHVLRRTDNLGRIGGEEFAALLPQTNTETALIIAQRIIHAVSSTPVQIRAQNLLISVSIGVTMHQLNDDNFDAILERADQALYQAKHEGRNRAIAH
ncbi:diguanylate cyclase [Pantanalinema rosaneae CENA516]|uniref:diguanylate cyclase n=1 Tax=Pantanalinema rosaneae TaxID=1620701 RepID=UPI003D6DFB14